MDGEARKTDSPPLVFEGARKSYKTHFWQRPSLSLAGLDLDVRRGEILGLLGPNGAGKTTSIKLALGLIFPDSGRVHLMGRPADDPRARERVGYLPENPNFPDDLTGRELVMLAARLHGLPTSEASREAERLLRRVGILDVADRKLRKYSKGMMQRAGMARALIGEPELLILDEPMSGLDPVGRREFRDLILELKERGVTVLFASHVLGDAEMLCDRVAILERGHLAAVYDIRELADERRILYWEAEVGGGDDVPGAEVVARRGERRLLRFSADAGFDRIHEALRVAGAEPLRIVPQRETLEHLFMRTLRREGESER